MIDDDLRERIEAMRAAHTHCECCWCYTCHPADPDGYVRRGRFRWKARYPRRTDNRLAAITYCEMGAKIIPLSPGSKVPSIASPHPFDSPERGTCHGECGQLGHGHHDARADVAWAEEHWGRRPHDGIAVRPEPDEIVLDDDPRHGGDVALAALEAEHGTLPETLTVISGRGDGGHHRWFGGVEGPVRQKLCPGVDILCHARNAVVVPPSQHSETNDPYWFKDPSVERADAPAWLVELATRPDPPPRPPRPRRPPWPRTWRMSPSQMLRRCQPLIDTVTDAVWGDRHNTLLWAACRAAEDGFLVEEDDLVWTELFDAADAAGLPHDEIYRVLRGAIAIAG